MEEKKKLKFSDIDSKSDLEKKIDGELMEEDIKKEADLYDQILYTIVPKTHDQSLGIFPKDQGLSHFSVILWNTKKGIPSSITDSDYKVLEVKVNNDIIRNNLKNVGGGAYTLKHVPNTLPMQEVDPISFRGE